MLLFSRQDKILFILDTTILILYRKLYINIVLIIVLNFEARQYNIKINLSISCSPKKCYDFYKVVLRVLLLFHFIGRSGFHRSAVRRVKYTTANSKICAVCKSQATRVSKCASKRKYVSKPSGKEPGNDLPVIQR